VDPDRDRHQRADLLLLEEGSLARGQFADVAGEDLVARAELREAPDADLLEAHVLQHRVLELWRDAGSHPFEPLACDPTPVGADVALEEIRTARSSGLAELAQ
jgi:hypothetical protein